MSLPMQYGWASRPYHCLLGWSYYPASGYFHFTLRPVELRRSLAIAPVRVAVLLSEFRLLIACAGVCNASRLGHSTLACRLLYTTLPPRAENMLLPSQVLCGVCSRKCQSVVHFRDVCDTYLGMLLRECSTAGLVDCRMAGPALAKIILLPCKRSSSPYSTSWPAQS